MADNPLSARRLPLDDPFWDSRPRDRAAEYEASQLNDGQETQGSGYVEGYTRNSAGGGGQPGWGLTSPPIAARHFPEISANRREWDLMASPTAGNDRPQTSTNQEESNPINSSIFGAQASALQQPNSVKHLTCWYWANKGCRLSDHACLYSHHDTGRVAEPPVQVQRGRPAVAGKNATNPQPVYRNWKGHHRSRSSIVGPQIQKQIRHIHAKAAQHSTPTLAKAEQSETEIMIKEDRLGSDEPTANFNRRHPNSHLSPHPTDSFRNMSIGIGPSAQPFHQQLSHSPHLMGGIFTAPSHSAQLTGGSNHYGLGGQHSTDGSYGGMGENRGGMGRNSTNDGHGRHHFGGNSPNAPDTSASPRLLGVQSGGPTQEMQRQMRVKDKVITELAGIVEMLEINYGISIRDQASSFENFMSIARSMMDEETRKAGNVVLTGEDKRRAFDVQAPSTSTPPYGRSPANHERLLTAMEGSMKLMQMEKRVLASSKTRKETVREQLESVQAAKLLPRGWVER